MSIRKKLKGGFTLVELMIVVAIIGILAVLAVYGVKKYMSNAKTAEARQALGRLGKDAASAFEGEHMTPGTMAEAAATNVTRQLCKSASAPIPPTISDVKGKKYQSSAAQWKADEASLSGSEPQGYACLRFELNTPQYFMYSYASDLSGSFVATANGDLDGNGTSSGFELEGKVQSARLNVSPTLKETVPDE